MNSNANNFPSYYINFFKILKFFIKSIIYFIPFFRTHLNKFLHLIEFIEEKVVFNNKSETIYPISKKSNIILEKNSFLSKLILNDFEYEERYLLNYLLQPNGHFFDIGANIGLYSILASEKIKNGNIYAFEPDIETRYKLENNLKLNNIINYKIIQQAISNTDFHKQILYSNQNGFDVFNSLIKPISDNYKTNQVETITLDTFIALNKINCNEIQFIKIDVEGLELEVLEGAKNLLKSNKNIIYMIEFNKDFNLHLKSKQTYQTLIKNNFKCFMYNHSVRKLINIEQLNSKKIGNFFIIHDTNIENIKNNLLNINVKLEL